MNKKWLISAVSIYNWIFQMPPALSATNAHSLNPQSWLYDQFEQVFEAEEVIPLNESELPNFNLGQWIQIDSEIDQLSRRYLLKKISINATSVCVVVGVFCGLSAKIIQCIYWLAQHILAPETAFDEQKRTDHRRVCKVISWYCNAIYAGVMFIGLCVWQKDASDRVKARVEEIRHQSALKLNYTP